MLSQIARIIFKVRDNSPTQTTRLLDLSYRMRVKCGFSVLQTMPLSRQQGGASTVYRPAHVCRYPHLLSRYLCEV